ncbi:MAG: PIN domain-containing protein [bacterium]
MVRDGERRAIITSFSLHSIEVILFSANKIDILEEFLSALLKFEGLTVFSTNLIDEIEVTKISRAAGLDFDDSLQYYVAKLLGLELVSFDKDFEDKGIKVLEPKNIVLNYGVR